MLQIWLILSTQELSGNPLRALYPEDPLRLKIHLFKEISWHHYASKFTAKKNSFVNSSEEVSSEGSPLVVMVKSCNESKLLTDKGNLKPKDAAQFNLANKSPLKQVMCPTTQEYSAIGAADKEKLHTCPNVIQDKLAMKAKRKNYSKKFAQLRGMFKSEAVKKPLSILNKIDSARILKEIGKYEE